MEMTRRTLVVAGAATAVVAALPVMQMIAPAEAATLVADMFYTEDEPWGAFVRAHVPKEQFDKAILHMIETNSDHRENGEDWLFESTYDDDDNERIHIVTGAHEYIYMRLDYVDDDRGEQYRFCKAADDGAIPITVVRY